MHACFMQAVDYQTMWAYVQTLTPDSHTCNIPKIKQYHRKYFDDKQYPVN